MRLRLLVLWRWQRRCLSKHRLRLRLYLLACSLVTPLNEVYVGRLLLHEMRVDVRGILSFWARGRSNRTSSSGMIGKFTHSLPPQVKGDRARLAFRSATRMLTRFPSALAARVMVSSVTETFLGSSKRSSCDLLVRSCLAIACLVLRWSCMACSSCHAKTHSSVLGLGV
jgi:hypothetical protein